ncbi:MAG: fumarylacetoacetate hydrolase family protein [Alphaproteobacteria bacterium]|nr:fumarylacetoacetate hydrolase family protein [Alphaproteobacteria bacterium]
MKLAAFDTGSAAGIGLVEGDEILDLRAVAPHLSPNLVDILAAGEAGLDGIRIAARSAPRLPLSAVRLTAPVKRPGKILGIGLNYRDHAAETGREPPTTQIWFNKQATSVNDPFAPVLMPKVSSALDYEVELVVVIGRHGRHVPRARASEIIGGYMVGCDYSVRDWQRATPTMIMGKGFDTHAPAGPWITTPDEVGDVAQLRLRCFVNGEKRQDGLAGDMIFDIAAQIEHLTKAFTLEPGDLIFTGTPAGVGAAYTPPKFLAVDDRVRVEIDRLGAIECVIGAERGETRIG